MSKKLNYRKLMKDKGVTPIELARKFKCSVGSIQFIMYGITQKGKIKPLMDKFLTQ